MVTVEGLPLSARHEDIPLRAQYFMKRFATRNRKTVQGFTPQTTDLLIKNDWQGNVRELENALERSVILLAGDYITERELPLSITQTGEGGRRDAASPGSRRGWA